MADNNKAEQAAEDEDIKKIDAMMSIDGKNAMPAVSTSIDPERFKKPKTAPKLPKVYKPKEPAKPPIVIKLADDKKPDEEVSVPVTTTAPKAEETPTPVPELSATDETIPPSEPGGSTDIDNEATDEAVDDIAAKESDTVLALEDARKASKERSAVTAGPGWKDKLKSFFKNKWTWAGIVIILLAVLATPFARYPLLGLFIKKPVTLTLLDSKSRTPVSQAEVTLAGHTAKTDADGKVSFTAKVGKQNLHVTKQYYQDLSTTYFVGLKKSSTAPISLVATGRLVPVTVSDRISGQPLANVQLKILSTTAKTNKSGQANVVLPASLGTAKFTASLNGFLSTQGSITVTDKVVPANAISLLANGQVYFLSNKSGNIDVVKANLDGSDRQVILAGTGHEDQNNTSLLASRDWRYLVLESRRSGSHASLSLIDTSNDKVTTIDNSDADYTLIGWYSHSFMYDVVSHGLQPWQPGRELVKSYDADRQQSNQLDSNLAEGTGQLDYAGQSFGNFYILNGALVYATQWFYSGSPDLTGKNFTIRAVQPNGQNKKDYQTFAANATTSINATLYSPQAVYFAVYNDKGNTNFYEYENQVAKSVSIDGSAFNQAYPTYLISPNGNQTFWTELRDGKNTLFTGDDNAGNKKQIASSSDYSPYGWYGDKYLLVSKNSSELYVMSAGGLSGNRQPLKITDYYKSARSFSGYGYGYGGL